MNSPESLLFTIKLLLGERVHGNTRSRHKFATQVRPHRLPTFYILDFYSQKRPKRGRAKFQLVVSRPRVQKKAESISRKNVLTIVLQHVRNNRTYVRYRKWIKSRNVDLEAFIISQQWYYDLKLSFLRIHFTF